MSTTPATLTPGAPKFHRLEFLRGAAALYVVLHHISSNYLHLQQTVIGTPFRFGQEAVILFFILSGFVICHSASRSRSFRFGDYFLKRSRRIYPIFLFSLLLAFFFPVREGKPYDPDPTLWFLGNFFMLQDIASKPGIWVQPFFGNSPLWSLSYEWLYYMVFFPIWKFVPEKSQKWLVGGLAVVAILLTPHFANPFFNILSAFPIWWTGVELARSYQKHGKVVPKDLIGQAIILAFCLGLYMVFCFQAWKSGQNTSIGVYPFAQMRMYFDIFLFAAVFFLWRMVGYKGFDWVFRWFSPIAPISYAIYVIHFPIILGMQLFGGSYFYLDLVCRMALMFAIAWVLEGPVQSWITARTSKQPR